MDGRYSSRLLPFRHFGITCPRENKEYGDRLVKELGLNDPAKYPHLTESDLVAARVRLQVCGVKVRLFLLFVVVYTMLLISVVLVAQLLFG